MFVLMYMGKSGLLFYGGPITGWVRSFKNAKRYNTMQVDMWRGHAEWRVMWTGEPPCSSVS